MIIRKVYNNLKCTMLLLLWLTCSLAVMAQERVVSGSVKDSNGAGLAGVSVIVKKSTTGTNSDMDGKYSISLGPNAVLIFSFIGYTTQEVSIGNQSVVDVVLAEETTQLGEVVVTALGIERTQKSLQSSVTKVPGVSLTSARENNLGSAMQGRVAGVNITKSQSGPAGSSRVIIRGNKSIGGSNQPLYVIDGIPMDNSQFGQVGVWGGTDQGDGLTSLNPEDIESITILKGAAAAALYGSRGGFGVINITTKRGTTKKGIGIEFNSNYVFEKYQYFGDLQEVYGAGGLGVNPADPTGPQIYRKASSQLEAWNWGNASMWGPKLDGTDVIQFDGIMRPYSHAGDNWERFYQTGSTWTNSIALTGGGNNQTYRFSFSDMKQDFIIPNSGFKRKNASLSTTGKFGKKVTYNAKVMYSNEIMNNRNQLGDSPGNAPSSIWRLANTINVNDLKGDPDKLGAVAPGVATPDLKATGEEFQQANNNWQQNPWWVAYQFNNQNIRDRFLTSADLRYNILDWLYVQGRIGMDYYTRNNNYLVPQGTGYQRGGYKEETSQFVREVNQEWTLGADKQFGKVRMNAFVGGNKMVRSREDISARGSDFNVPFFTSVNNARSQSFGYGYNESGINSLFGSAEVSYAGFLYITATGRNDWFSVLNPDNNSKFYPSLGGSFVLTDAFKSLPQWFSYGKLRAAWGQVATANVDPYAVVPTYSLLGQGHGGVPMGTYSFGETIPNPNLSPALSTEIEFGFDARFLNGRTGIEFTYYNQKTTDDILSATISQASGFNSTSVNIGELSNKGIELLISGTPVVGKFTWDISLNIAHNENLVVELAPGVTRLFVDEPRTRSAGIYHVQGEPFGMILGYKQKMDPASGLKVYDANGYPVRSDVFEVLGNGIAKITGGITNAFSWKSFKLDALVDFKMGGDIYSGTNVNLTSQGSHMMTLADREGGKLVEGVIQTGTNTDGTPIYGPFSLALNQQQTRNYWGNLASRAQENFVYDASFVKLRQVSLEYRLPAKLIDKTPLTNIAVAFVGRNLAFIYKDIPNIDPEAAYGSGSGQGIEQMTMPSTRSYGFNIRVTF